MFTGLSPIRASLVVNTDIGEALGPGFNSMSLHRNIENFSDVFNLHVLHLILANSSGLCINLQICKAQMK